MNRIATIPKLLRIAIPSLLIVIWFALAGLGGPIFGRISEVASNDQATFLPASAESTKLNQRLKEFRDESSVPAIIVFTHNDEKLSSDNLAAIKNATAKFGDIAGAVGTVSPPITSDDGKAALVVVNVSSNTKFKEFVATARTELDRANLTAEYAISGPVGFLSDLSGAFAGIDGLLLGVALAVVFIILLVVYRSPILPFIVLFNSMFALCAAILIVFYLAKTGAVTLNGQVQGILFILVIGAATDYSLLYIARYREELTRHKETYRAIVESLKRSFEPILAAGGTVIAGLLCLLLSDLNSNKALGPVGAIGIVLAVAATLSFLPSMLSAFGRKVFWPRIPQYAEANRQKSNEQDVQGLWPKVAKVIEHHSRRVWAATTVVLVIVAVGITQLRADGVSQSDLILGKSQARDGQQLINEHFPGGSGSPTQIMIPSDKLDKAVERLEGDKGVSSVSVAANNAASGSMPVGRAADKIRQQIRETIQKQAMTEGAHIPDAVLDTIVAGAYPYKNATPKVVNNDVLIEATLKDDADSGAAQATIERLRSEMHDLDGGVLVGGTTAVQLDTRKSGEHDRAIVIPVVLVVITIILMLLLRSILAPLLLLFTTILSFASILGISALVFNNLMHLPGADPSVVLYGFVFLVALGIDYNIFLMTRVREESLKIGTHKGMLAGLIVTGSVITSAGIVLAATFAALSVIPILFLLQLAFIVGLGVLLDTVVVRSLLVPALVYDIGNFVWWPSRKFKNKK